MTSDEALALQPGDTVFITPKYDEAPSWTAEVAEVIDCRGSDVEPSLRTVRVGVKVAPSKYCPDGIQRIDRRRVSGPVRS